MSLVTIDGVPQILIGSVTREFYPVAPAQTTSTIDAAKEATIYIAQIWTEDGASHTIDTTGSSSLGWLAGGVTFANAGTTVKVGLAAVDTTTGPPGRAVNVADVITFDVSKSLTGGGGGITANAWNEHAPDTGTKTIANGDLVAFCVQMTAFGGADSISVAGLSSNAAAVRPALTEYLGGTYTGASRGPVFAIRFSDGTYGFGYGCVACSVATTTNTYNSGSSPNEYGNLFTMPFPAKIYGIVASSSFAGDADLILYTDPLGTPAAAKTISVDANTIGAASVNRLGMFQFTSPYSVNTGDVIAIVLKPTTVTNLGITRRTYSVAAHQKTEQLGTAVYGVSRSGGAGAFASMSSNKERFAMGILVGAFEIGGTRLGTMALG